MTESNGEIVPHHAAVVAGQPVIHPRDEGTVKDTIESILVAFILAFIFRAFVVEAFVIPTGSMATTLMGAHSRFVCDDCGMQYDVNYSNPSGDDTNVPDVNSAGAAAVCPNCGYVEPRDNAGDPAHWPVVSPGDRILVLKYLYIFQEPARWDVVVFKAPPYPEKYDYQQNYIKRLVGKPGETIMVLDGDVYVGAADAQPAQMVVQTKPRSAQEAMWRLVSDADYVPRQLDRGGLGTWHQPWRQSAGQGWNLPADGRTRKFNFSDAGDGELTFDPLANPSTHALTDWIPYDEGQPPSLRPTGAGGQQVSDLKLSLVYDRKDGQGPLRLKMSKRNDTFVAELNGHTARLLHYGPAGVENELIAPVPLELSAPAKIEFQNVDYRVSLRVNGADVFATTPAQYSPNIGELLGRPPQIQAHVGIEAQNQTCDISHLSLWRDVYYRDDSSSQWADPNHLMHLGKDEFFVLGDNSPVSLDARYWTWPIKLPAEGLDVQSGRVPRAFMLGKAFFVYWPAGNKPFGSLPALLPNFGDMRFIH